MYEAKLISPEGEVCNIPYYEIGSYLEKVVEEFIKDNDDNKEANDNEPILDNSKNNDEELKNFNFKCQNFENIELEKNNLLVANFSIPFCNKNYFNEFWNKIANSILKERILCWELFWIKRLLGKYKRANGIFIKRTSIRFI